MTIHRLEIILGLLLTILIFILVMANIPANPQLIEWLLPLVAAIITLVWLLGHETGEHQRN